MYIQTLNYKYSDDVVLFKLTQPQENFPFYMRSTCESALQVYSYIIFTIHYSLYRTLHGSPTQRMFAVYCIRRYSVTE